MGEADAPHKVPIPEEVDDRLKAALQSAGQDIPVPQASRVLAQPRALLASKKRRRRWLRAGLPAAFVAAVVLFTVMWGSGPQSHPSGEQSPPEAELFIASVPAAEAEPEIESLPPQPEIEVPSMGHMSVPAGQVTSLKEAVRQAPFPLLGPEEVPEGVVRVGIKVLPAQGLPEASRVVLSYIDPADRRLEFEQVGPWPAGDGDNHQDAGLEADPPAAEQSPAEENTSFHPLLGSIDRKPVSQLEWVEEGVLFRIYSDWDEADTHLLLDALVPLTSVGQKNP